MLSASSLASCTFPSSSLVSPSLSLSQSLLLFSAAVNAEHPKLITRFLPSAAFILSIKSTDVPPRTLCVLFFLLYSSLSTFVSSLLAIPATLSSFLCSRQTHHLRSTPYEALLPVVVSSASVCFNHAPFSVLDIAVHRFWILFCSRLWLWLVSGAEKTHFTPYPASIFSLS